MASAPGSSGSPPRLSSVRASPAPGTRAEGALGADPHRPALVPSCSGSVCRIPTSSSPPLAVSTPSPWPSSSLLRCSITRRRSAALKRNSGRTNGTASPASSSPGRRWPSSDPAGSAGRSPASRIRSACASSPWDETVIPPGPNRSASTSSTAASRLPVMLAEADCLVVCAPLTPETEDLLEAAEFAALKPGAVFVNIGRGAIVDENALLRGLREGRIAFAALDVFRDEPLPPDSPFWDLPNVLINPHSASTVVTENSKLTELFIQNLGHYLAGELDQMSPILDKQRLY